MDLEKIKLWCRSVCIDFKKQVMKGQFDYADLAEIIKRYDESLWTSVTEYPPIEEEYNVIWNIDGFVTSTMYFNFTNKRWIDTRGNGTDVTDNILFWRPMPHIPKEIQKLPIKKH